MSIEDCIDCELSVDLLRGFAVAITALLAIAAVASFGTPWPQRDSFILFDWMARYREGGFSLLDLLSARNNEHFVGFHYLTSLVVLLAGGANFKLLMYLSALLLVLSIYFVLKTAALDRLSYGRALLLSAVVTASLLNPIQASYLLWEFQVWWYWLLFFFSLTVFLIERFGRGVYPIVLLVCAIGTLCGSQGLFLWLTTGVHFLLFNLRDGFSPGRETRFRSIVFLAHSVIFMILAFMVMTTAPKTPSAGSGIQIDLVAFPAYFAQLVGGAFGVRSPHGALGLGVATFAALAIACLCLAVNRHSLKRTTFRLGLLLAMMGLLCTLAFAVGRQKHGIQWALWNFHATPPLLPFFTGLGLMSFAALPERSARSWRLTGVPLGIVITLAVVPSISAIPVGYARASELRRVASSAHLASCQERDYPLYVRLRLNGLEDHGGLYERTKAIAIQNCAREVDLAEAGVLLNPPSSYLAFGHGDGERSRALAALWWVYSTHLDLQRAFPPSAPSTPVRLIQFAHFNAREGSTYEPDLLPPFQSVFQGLRPE